MPHGIKRPTVLIPAEYRAEIMKMSKAALADMVWSLAGCADGVESSDNFQQVMARIRIERETVLDYRK